MILGKIFAEELKKRGIDKLHVGYERPSLQYLAVKMLVKDYGIVNTQTDGVKIKDEFGVSLYKGRGEEKVNFVFKRKGEKIELNLPKYPLFVIDLGLYDSLDEEERKKTRLQVQLSLNVVRNYLWDGNLALIHSPFTVGKAKVIDSIDNDDCIVLDPYGDIEADENILRNTNVFILGGIVDKGRRLKYATRTLAETYNYPCKRVKLTLRGSIVGVPDEINKIIDIVLRVITGEELEKAIIKNQSKADKIARVLRDVEMGYSLEDEIKWLEGDDKLFEIVKSKLSKVKIDYTQT